MAKNKEKQTPKSDEDIAADLLLKEADESLRQDRLNALWNEWGSTIIGVALMIILGTIIGVSWQKWRMSSQATQTANLMQYSLTNNPEIELKGSYRGIANMMAAGALATNDEADAAKISELLNEASNTGLPHEWKMLAKWGALRTSVDTKTDVASKIKIADELVNLANKKNNPYAPAILMEAAVVKGENGHVDEAITLLQEASKHPIAANVPELETRISNYLQLYIAESK